MGQNEIVLIVRRVLKQEMQDLSFGECRRTGENQITLEEFLETEEGKVIISVVDQVWNNYDLDGSNTLELGEVKLFLSE